MYGLRSRSRIDLLVSWKFGICPEKDLGFSNYTRVGYHKPIEEF